MSMASFDDPPVSIRHVSIIFSTRWDDGGMIAVIDVTCKDHHYLLNFP